ncbi:hypothetical protein CP082626L3_0446B, partial [Chlamydia psittaci 08-2626_L3]
LTHQKLLMECDSCSMES